MTSSPVMMTSSVGCVPDHLLQPLEHRHAYVEPLLPLELLPPVAVHAPVVRVQVYERQLVPPARLEVVGVVGWGDLGREGGRGERGGNAIMHCCDYGRGTGGKSGTNDFGKGRFFLCNMILIYKWQIIFQGLGFGV